MHQPSADDPHLPPIRHIPENFVMTALNSHEACRKNLQWFVDANPERCPFTEPFQESVAKGAIYSYQAVPCEGADKLIGDVWYRCRVTSEYRNCSSGFLRAELSRDFVFRCVKALVPIINGADKRAERGWAKCVEASVAARVAEKKRVKAGLAGTSLMILAGEQSQQNVETITIRTAHTGSRCTDSESEHSI